jgi:hypothetical protein
MHRAIMLLAALLSAAAVVTAQSPTVSPTTSPTTSPTNSPTISPSSSPTTVVITEPPQFQFVCATPLAFNPTNFIFDPSVGYATCGDLVFAPEFASFMNAADCTNEDFVLHLWHYATFCCSDKVANTMCGESGVQSVCQDPANFLPANAIIGAQQPCWVVNTVASNLYPIMATVLFQTNAGINPCQANDDEITILDDIVYVALNPTTVCKQ